MGALAAGCGAGSGAAADLAAGAVAAPPSASSVRISVPSETLSPFLSLSSLITPACGAGTSIVALSDSSVMSGSSFFTLSPGLTSTSITGMFLKSPMSGTCISMSLLISKGVIRCSLLVARSGQALNSAEGGMANEKRVTKNESLSDLSGAEHDVLEGSEALEPDRAARVQLVGRDADFRSQAVLVAVGKAGGGVHHDRARIHFAQEALRARLVLRDDGVGVLRAVVRDVADRLAEVPHDEHRQDGVEVLGVPVLARKSGV